jgi:hypothetical protein
MFKPMFDGLTNNDLLEIVNFYKSPVGKKLASLTQEIPGFIHTIMPKWEQRISNVILPEMINRLEKRGWNKDGKRIR